MSDYLVKYHRELAYLEETISRFEKEISICQEDLVFFKGRGTSHKTIFYKEKQIENLIVIKTCFELFIAQSKRLLLEFQKEKKEATQTIDKLVTICMIHGITNLDWFMYHSNEYLGAHLNEAIEENWRQMPWEFLHGKQQLKK